MSARRPPRDLTEGERILRSRGANRARLIAEEHRQTARWFYLSFASDYEFLGAAIVRAHDLITAVQRTSQLRIRPKGDVMCWPLTRSDLRRIPVDLWNRLLSRAEVALHLDGKRADE